MPSTTTNLGLPYPVAADAPDGPGGIYNLAAKLDSILGGGTWFPTLGGGNGATLGTSSGSDGTYLQIGKHVTAKGRLVFGSGASFGTGSATVSGLPGTVDTNHSAGYGWFQPASGSLIPVILSTTDGANMVIRPIVSGASGSDTTMLPAATIGTPAQSSQLRFVLDLTLA